MSTEDIKVKAFDFFTKLTWRRLLISFIAATFSITLYTVWENRQTLFDVGKTGLNGVVGDYPLNPPGKTGKAIVNDFLKRHPEVLMLSLLDADPETNTRKVIARFSLDQDVLSAIEQETKGLPGIGNGPLFTADPENNLQVLAIINGEFKCAKTSGIVLRVFPEFSKRVVWQCRVPVPPAFNKATGWMTLHLSKWPLTADQEFDLKSDSLTMANDYYNREVLGK